MVSYARGAGAVGVGDSVTGGSGVNPADVAYR
jgi:hypothetical protein